ncbi:MAG: threonine synthase [Dehalococcoidales bacterium]|nr:threonine synthase [Dehalococcoidales bacterium]
MRTLAQRRGVLARYGQWLPLTNKTPALTLGEGDTPLVRAERLHRSVGCAELYFKLEGCNPTGSFKDRGMVVAVAKAVEEGGMAVMCASTGNTSASAAAFAAHVGIDCIVLVPGGNIALGKLAQALAYGAKVIAVEGNFDESLTIVRELTERYPFVLVNSINPHRIEGQKTAAFEVSDELGDAPDYLAIPVGNAGNITAYWKGFKEYHEAGVTTRRPVMLGFQAEGAAPIVRNQVVPRPETVATAIRIGNPASWKKAVAARDESGGRIDMVSDDEILAAYKLLAGKEGIFVEPASAASVAGVLRLAREKAVDFAGKRVVCVLTGNGLKDPDTAVRTSEPYTKVEADLGAVERMLGLK